MKKLIACLTLALVAARALPLSLVGCKKTSIYGTYKAYKFEVEFTGEIDPEDKAAWEEDVKAYNEDLKTHAFECTINKDGTCSMVEGEYVSEGTWKKENGEYVVYAEDHGEEHEVMRFTIKKGVAKILFDEEENAKLYCLLKK